MSGAVEIAGIKSSLSVAGAIQAVDVAKSYPIQGGTRRILQGVSFTVRAGEKLAVLGRNGAGKSTLVRLIAGIELPTSGRILRTMSLSWPIALSGGFGGSMTGNDCIRFIARIHSKDFFATRDFVEDFAELGKYLRMPIKTYSSGMRARLAFGLSLSVDFGCYLIDEVLSVGDSRFQRKSFDALFIHKKNSSMIIVSHNIELVSEFCSSALILKSGHSRVFNDIRLALDIYSSL